MAAKQETRSNNVTWCTEQIIGWTFYLRHNAEEYNVKHGANTTWYKQGRYPVKIPLT